MFKITTLSKDTKRILTVNLILMSSYKIYSEKQLRNTIQNAINSIQHSEIKNTLQLKLDNNQLLEILRFWSIPYRIKKSGKLLGEIRANA